MEKKTLRAGTIWCLYGFLVASLLLCSAHADGKIKQVTDPTGNVNLSPFEQWRSASECLQNKSSSCPDKYTLNETGWLNVTAADKDNFCSSGCADHTNDVLTCIDLVKRHYKFVNKATVQNLRAHIAYGCTYGFDGTTLITSNARGMAKSKTVFFISVLSTVIFTSY